MFNFNFKNDVFLGVDVGTASIKIVEIKILNGKPLLSNYAWMSLHGDDLGKRDNNSEYFYSVLPSCIKRIIKKAKISGENAYVSLPSFGGLITLIDFPEMAVADMEQAIKFEAHKYIPTSLDDVVISWDVVERKEVLKKAETDKTDATVKVLLVAASKSKILKYENLIKAVGLTLKSVNIEAFSVVRSLVGNDQGSFVIVDIGARICNIILVEKGVIRINRNIDAGGFEITNTIAKGMQIDFERADNMKISGKNFFTAESAITFYTLELISGEVERIIRAYHKEAGKDKISEIILSGGTANLTGITDYFFNKLKIKTVIGNPLAGIGYDARLEQAVSGMRASFAVAIGSALKGIDEYFQKEIKNNK
jgi:type IV pilus assembly protein PilM